MKLTRKQLNEIAKRYLLKEMSLLPTIMSFLVGCKAQPTSTKKGEIEIFSLGKPLTEDDIKTHPACLTMSKDNKDQLLSFASRGLLFLGEDLSLSDYWQHETIQEPKHYRDFDGPDYKVRDIMMQFSCMPLGNKIYYTIDNKETVLYSGNSRRHPSQYEDNSKPLETGFDANAYEDLARLGSPTDTVSIITTFKYIHVGEAKKTEFIYYNKNVLGDTRQEEICDEDRTVNVYDFDGHVHGNQRFEL